MSGRTFYMQQRYYDPIAARFMSLDPVTTDANTGKSFGRYHYADNNPYKFTDPNGRESTCEWGAGCEWIVAPATDNDSSNRPVARGGATGSASPTQGMSPDGPPRRLPIGPPPLISPKQLQQLLNGFNALSESLEDIARAAAGLILNSSKSPEDLIGESTRGRETKGRTDQYDHAGGRPQRDKDFDSLGAGNVKDRGNGVKTGTLPDGRAVNVHDSSDNGVPTIQIGNGSREVKIRYP